jgi:hypothetical protein
VAMIAQAVRQRLFGENEPPVILVAGPAHDVVCLRARRRAGNNGTRVRPLWWLGGDQSRPEAS